MWSTGGDDFGAVKDQSEAQVDRATGSTRQQETTEIGRRDKKRRKIKSVRR